MQWRKCCRRKSSVAFAKWVYNSVNFLFNLENKYKLYGVFMHSQSNRKNYRGSTYYKMMRFYPNLLSKISTHIHIFFGMCFDFVLWSNFQTFTFHWKLFFMYVNCSWSKVKVNGAWPFFVYDDIFRSRPWSSMVPTWATSSSKNSLMI